MMAINFNTALVQPPPQKTAKPAPGKSPEKNAADEFLKFMQQTPEERMHDLILRSLGLTEEQLKALPPDERAKIEHKITEILKEKMQQKLHEEAAREAAS